MLRTQYQEGDCVTGEQIGREMKRVEISWDTAGEILSVKPNWVWLCFFYCWCYMMYIFFLEHLDKIHHTAVHSGEHRYQESTIKLYIYTHVCVCIRCGFAFIQQKSGYNPCDCVNFFFLCWLEQSLLNLRALISVKDQWITPAIGTSRDITICSEIFNLIFL